MSQGGFNRLAAAATMVLAVGLAACGAVAEEIIIKFQPNTNTAEVATYAGKVLLTRVDKAIYALPAVVGATSVTSVLPVSVAEPRFDGPFSIVLADTVDTDAVLTGLASDPDVLYATRAVIPVDVLGEDTKAWFPPQEKIRFCDSQRGYHYRTTGEPLMDGDWCTAVSPDSVDHDMDLPQAWGVTTGSSSVLVGIIDTGFCWRHADLGGHGPVSSVSLSDSLFYYYQDGIFYQNNNELPGDANGDGRPGVAYQDDDGDGLVDEDSDGYDYRNDAESDVVVGTATGISGLTVTDSNANFGNLVGLWFYGWGGSVTGYKARIVSNTATTLTTEPIEVTPGFFLQDWSYLLPVYDNVYRIGDGLSNHETWPDPFVDDSGWVNDLAADDDENGCADDTRGYDFVDAPGQHSVNDDTSDRDFDVRGANVHGSACMSQVASTINTGLMMGVAPGVRLVPARAIFVNDTGYLSLDVKALINSVEYMRTIGVDVLSTSLASSSALAVVVPIIQDLVDDGVVFVNGAGNDYSDVPHVLNGVTPSVMVAGLNTSDVRYDVTTQWGRTTTRFGSWVDISAKEGPIHVATAVDASGNSLYGIGWAGTSLSGPRVAGVAALIKSAYPGYTRDQIINKLLTSVDDIYADGRNAGYEGLLGSGRVNAYKAVSLYGTVPAVATDTTWSGTVWVGGDITVPPGKTLTIAPGTIINVAQDDLLSAGSAPSRVEFTVYGNIDVQGTALAPVLFECHTDGAGEWGPIALDRRYGSLDAGFSHVVMRDMESGIDVVGIPGSYTVGLDIADCIIETRHEGLVTGSLMGDDVISVTGTVFSCSSDSTYGVTIQTWNYDDGAVVTIGGNTTVEGYSVGLYIMAGSGVTVSDTSVDSCAVGMFVGPGYSSAPTIGPGVAVTNSGDLGAYFGNGVTCNGLAINGSGANGAIINGDADFGVNGMTVANCGLHGVQVYNVTAGHLLDNISVSNVANSGFRITDCSPTLGSGVQVSGADYAGIYCSGGSPHLEGPTISNSETGVWTVSDAHVVGRNLTVTGCNYGVCANPTGVGNFGTSADWGGSTFTSIGKRYALNWNLTTDLMMVGDCFDGSENPPAYMFEPKVYGAGTVIFLPGHCE